MYCHSRILLALLLLTLFDQIFARPASKQAKKSDISSLSDKHQAGLITTIEQVEQILAEDPNLPRLTRGEIAELYEQITREEYEKSLHTGDIGRAKNMRALMLVLPYNTDNVTEENLQELYTRPPITKVIDSYFPPQTKKLQTITTTISTIRSSDKLNVKQTGNIAATTYKPSFHHKQTVSVSEPSPTTYHPNKPNFKMSTTAIDFQPITTTINSPVTIDFGTSAKVEKPQLSRKPAAQRFSSHYSAKDTHFPNRKKTTTEFADIIHSLGITPAPVPAFAPIYLRQTSKPSRIAENYYAAESAPKPVISSIIPQPSSSSLTYEDLMPKVNTDAYISFRPLNIGEEIRVKPEVEDYLTRFGIITNRKRKSMNKANRYDDNDTTISAQNDLVKTTTTVSSKPTNKTIKTGATSLKRNMKATRTTTKPQTKQATTSISTQESITATNINSNLNIPVKANLASPKAFHRRIDTNFDINSDTNNDLQSEESQRFVQLQQLLNNLEELKRLNVTLKKEMLTKYSSNETIISSQMGPDPLITNESDEPKNEIKRQSENTTQNFSLAINSSNVNDSDINDDDISLPPQPTRFNFDLSLDNEDASSSGSLIEKSTPSSSSTTLKITTTTEESRNGALSDLEDSFGPDPISEAPLPPKKKNGFYFLADWNSFLEVGQDEDQVVVRFSPKIGDPRLFIPVKVP